MITFTLGNVAPLCLLEGIFALEEFRMMMKRRREELGLTQWEVAERLGFQTHHPVQKWEKGTGPIRVEDVPEWAKVLGIPVNAALMAWVSSKTGIEKPFIERESVLQPGTRFTYFEDGEAESVELDEGMVDAMTSLIRYKKRLEADSQKVN